MAYYKIADGPLDLNKRTIEVSVEGENNPITIYPNNWEDTTRYFGEGEIYITYIDLGYLQGGQILILKNAILDSELFNFGGTPPFNGIFVSENIESISYSSRTLYKNKIDANLLDLPQQIIMRIEEGDSWSEPGQGHMFFGNALISVGTDTPISFSLSNGQRIDDIVEMKILYASNENYPATISNNEGVLTISPGAGRSMTVYMLRVEYDTNKSVSFVLAIYSFDGPK